MLKIDGCGAYVESQGTDWGRPEPAGNRGVDGSARPGGRRVRSGARFLPAGPPAGARAPVRRRVSSAASTRPTSTRSRPRRSALSGRPRAGAQDQEPHPLERHGHGGARQQVRPRHRRAHLDLRLAGHAGRSRLQPLLPRLLRRPARRPGLLPGPRLARHLRPRVPRRPPHRKAPGELPPRTARPARASPPIRTPG